MRYTEPVPLNLYQIPSMTSQTRDFITLYAIAAMFVLITLYADGGLDGLFQAISQRL
jgi:hypothetical protein